MDEALDVAAQVASALAAAHEAGIVHRDIKPENIMLRRDRIVKVLDFGLAKLAPRQSAVADSHVPTGTAVRTNPGVVMGTANYMSPEQARGHDVDHRTDIWSLGIVLYEMLTGRAPFEGETPSHVTVAIMENDPPPLARYAEVPAEAERIVTKALHKDRRERYQTASDMTLDLKSLRQELEVEARLKRASQPGADSGGPETNGVGRAAAAGAFASRTVHATPARPTSSAEYLVGQIKRHRLGAALAGVVLAAALTTVSYFYFFAAKDKPAAPGEAIDSVAVLPFANEGGTPDAEYLSDGITDHIINSLSRLPNLRVVSLGAVIRYKGRQVDPQQVGRELNVRAVLLGRLVRRGDDLTISAELADAADNRRLWGEQYTRNFADILAVQDDIARQIAAGLRLSLTGEDERRLAKRYTDNAKAYELYTLGVYHMRGLAGGGTDPMEFFERAIKLDPNYALAYAGMSRAYFGRGQRGHWLPKEARQKMEWAAMKAVEIDPDLADARAQLGLAKKSNFDWAGAEREFKRALELDPNSEDSLFTYTVYLMHTGRTDEALAYARRYEEVTGGSTPYNLPAFAYLYAHEFDKAIERYQKRSRNSSAGNFQLAECYLGKGMYEEAVAEMEKVVARVKSPQSWTAYPVLAYAYAAAGRRGEALKILAEQKEHARRGYISPFNFAIIYTGLGDRDQAFKYLNQAFDEGSQVLPHFPKRPLFDRLHSDPRYTELLRKMNFPM